MIKIYLKLMYRVKFIISIHPKWFHFKGTLKAFDDFKNK